jgi:molybdopterin-guanine dinucleotide biosynthesis protein B
LISNPESSPSSAASPDSRDKAVSFVGPSNSGKTELICRLVDRFASQGLKVAVVKHSHKLHLGDDGKDTGRFRQAGAATVALAAPGVLQITRSLPQDPPLAAVLAALPGDTDLILVEGYKSGSLPQIALVLSSREPLPTYPHLIALVSREPLTAAVPTFLAHQVAEIAGFIKTYLGLA